MITESRPTYWNESLLDLHANLGFVPHGVMLKTTGVPVKSCANCRKWYLYKP